MAVVFRPGRRQEAELLQKVAGLSYGQQIVARLGWPMPVPQGPGQACRRLLLGYVCSRLPQVAGLERAK